MDSFVDVIVGFNEIAVVVVVNSAASYLDSEVVCFLINSKTEVSVLCIPLGVGEDVAFLESVHISAALYCGLVVLVCENFEVKVVCVGMKHIVSGDFILCSSAFFLILEIIDIIYSKLIAYGIAVLNHFNVGDFVYAKFAGSVLDGKSCYLKVNLV